MKKTLMAVLGLAMAVNIFAAGKAGILTSEQAADKLYAERNAVTETAAALKNIDKCIGEYSALFAASPSDVFLYKYVKAVDFKYDNLVTDKEVRKKAYKDLMPVLEKFCAGNTACANSCYISYCNMTLWGRYGELIDLMEAATSGIGTKIKENGEKMYVLDREFKNRAACYSLGRLHYKAPNIVLLMTWPDKNLSRKYLEEYMEKNPDSPMGKMFLADTLWDLGDREKAAALYREVLNSAPRPAEYFEDVKAIELCRERAKEQGIQ
jgi:tetratricopeptide (TPR) repeat protein